jgi:XrtJ-associated TM-motif-TM protein
MSKNTVRWVSLGIFLIVGAVVSPLYAQHGCVESPENPTAILGMIGAAGLLYSPVKTKVADAWRRRREHLSNR